MPVWDKPIPMALLDNIKHNQPLPKITLVDYQNKDRQMVDRISQMQKNYENFKIYEVADRFCQDTCEIIDTNGKPLYFDEGHLTLTGSKRLEGLFDRVISDLITLSGEVTAQRISNK